MILRTFTQVFYEVYTNFMADGKATGWIRGKTIPPMDSLRHPVGIRALSQITYLRTGIEQKKHQVFPVTVWVVPDENRKQKLIEGIEKTFKNGPKMFAVITDLEFEDLIKHGATDGLH